MVTYCKTEAQANAEMAEWLKTAVGKSMPNQFGNQCTAAMQWYSVALFGRPWIETLRLGNAIQHIDNANTVYFTKIWNNPNDPNLLPRAGDIAVYKGAAPLWDGKFYGHTGSVDSFNAAAQTLVQQDGAAPPTRVFPGGYSYSVKPAHKGTFLYIGDPSVGDVRGWLRPKWQKVVYTGADTRGYGTVTTAPQRPSGPGQAPAGTAELWLPGAVRSPQPGAVTLNKSLPARVTWHITSDVDPGKAQPTFSGVATYLKNQQYCPHLMWDPVTGHVEQYYPANVGSRALAAWNEDGKANIQIEVLFSRGAWRDGKQYWVLADTPLKGFDKIMQWLDSHGIPRVWPMGAPPALHTNSKRDTGIWNSKAGHYGHVHVPNNDHTDPGIFPDITKVPYAAGRGSTTASAAKNLNTLEELMTMSQADFNREKKIAGTAAWTLVNDRDRGVNIEKRLKNVEWAATNDRDRGLNNEKRIIAMEKKLDTILAKLEGK